MQIRPFCSSFEVFKGFSTAFHSQTSMQIDILTMKSHKPPSTAVSNTVLGYPTLSILAKISKRTQTVHRTTSCGKASPAPARYLRSLVAKRPAPRYSCGQMAFQNWHRTPGCLDSRGLRCHQHRPQRQQMAGRQAPAGGNLPAGYRRHLQAVRQDKVPCSHQPGCELVVGGARGRLSGACGCRSNGRSSRDWKSDCRVPTCLRCLP